MLICLFGTMLATNTLLDAKALRDVSEAEPGTDFTKPISKFETPALQTERARRSLQLRESPPEFEIDLLRTSLDSDPWQPGAQALLAFALISEDQDAPTKFNQALARSFELCLLCDEDLVKWRIDLVIAFWDRTDEANRKAAFEGVDFARWWYLDGEYLEALERRAARRNIPYAAYRSAVDTPIRPEEIRPAEE
ncbi:MAG: hypothetical protein RLN72_11565 [Henriciella sp.]